MEERKQLKQTLKPHWVWAIALGSAVGWGCFVLPTIWMGQAGPLGAIIGLGIGGLLMLIIAVSYGFMVKNFPVSGGEFAYAYIGFGRNHAYICGWFLTLGYICIVALNASALALLGKFIIPSVASQGYLYSVGGWDVFIGEVLIASLALIIFAYLNIRGAAVSGRLQFVFCLILILGVVAITVGMLLNPATSFSNMQPLFKPEIPVWTAVIAIVAIAPWAYVGFDNIPQAAEEFNFSPEKAFKLIVLSIIVAALLYSLMIAVTALSTPWQKLVSGQPIWGTGDVVSDTLGSIGVTILAIALCMGVFTGLNGFYVSASRVLFAMGRAQILPKTFSELHPKYETPHVGVIFTCACCLVAPWFGREVLLWIVDMSAIGVTIAYSYTCIVAYKFFKWSDAHSGIREEDHLNGTVSPIKKSFALLGAICGMTFLGLLLIPQSPAFLGKPSLIALLVWLLIGVIFYLYKGNVFRKIPEEELDYYILGETKNNIDPEFLSKTDIK
ncbi:APC family permease [Alkalihalobacillus deserti]|uniref:APC family permease n=1 Tax=Alkalihalobacillus deserti TaxID=2879466 RepID=UPI001D1458A8|nr:APC family permease [Alkalihalobacillus deserti]